MSGVFSDDRGAMGVSLVASSDWEGQWVCL